MSNNIDRQYKELLEHILVFGNNKSDRTGTGTRSVFGWKIVHRMEEGFPLLTTKKMYTKGIITELLWFLRGDTNIKYLVDNDCHIWDGDCFSHYQKEFKKLHYHTAQMSKEEFINRIKTDNEFAYEWGELGPIYGKQWRSYRYYFPKTYPEVSQYEQYIGVKTIDQIANLISELKTNPDSRRLMVNAWNVGELDQMVLPPCHYGFQVYTRELSFDERLRLANYDKERFNSIDEWISWYKNEPSGYYMGIDYSKDTELTDLGVPTRAISLMWNQRSVDVPLGLPFNIASYGLLLEIIAKAVNMVPEEVIGNLGDCHIYNNQIDGVKEQITRKPYKLPTLKHMKTDEFYRTLSEDMSLITHLDINDFVIEDYKSHPSIKMPLSN